MVEQGRRLEEQGRGLRGSFHSKRAFGQGKAPEVEEWMGGISFGQMFHEFVGSGTAWRTIHKKCERVLGGTFVDVEISGCSMSVESTKEWVDHCVCERDSFFPLLHVTFFGGMLCT